MNKQTRFSGIKRGFYIALLLTFITGQCYGQCNVNGGTISTGFGISLLVTCPGDGVRDTVEIKVFGQSGPNFSWITSDDFGNILSFGNNPPRDFENAEIEGTCRVWHLAYDDSFSGLEIGKNLNAFKGCFDLSNPVTIVKNTVNGGVLSTLDGLDSLTFGKNTKLDDLRLEGAVGRNSLWIVTSIDRKIIRISDRLNFDFSNLEQEEIYLYHLSYSGRIGVLIIGQPINNISGCFDLSNPIKIKLLKLNGGILSINGGAQQLEYCFTQNSSSYQLEASLNNAFGEQKAWVLTDSTTKIIALPQSLPFPIQPSTDTKILLYNISYNKEGFSGLNIGNQLQSLQGEFDLSNPLTITMKKIVSARLTLADNSTNLNFCNQEETFEIGPVTLNQPSISNSAWVLMDNTRKILQITISTPNSISKSLSGYPVLDLCYISYDGTLSNFSVGNSIDNVKGCYALSNFIDIQIGQVNGGSIRTANNLTTQRVCSLNSSLSDYALTVNNNQGSAGNWILTNIENKILAILNQPELDLSTINADTISVQYISYVPGISGLRINEDIKNLSGCYDLSNSISLIKENVEGGLLSFSDGSTVLSSCEGDIELSQLDFSLTGSSGALSRWIITDLKDQILQIMSTPPSDVSLIQEQSFKILNISFNGSISGLKTGNTLNEISGCMDFSNAVEIYRNQIKGGKLTTDTQLTEFTLCNNTNNSENFLKVGLAGSTGSKSLWVLTDLDENILQSGNFNGIDMESVVHEKSLLWNISYDGELSGVATGANLNTLEGCFGLSNPITLYKKTVAGGQLSFLDQTKSLLICETEPFVVESEMILLEDTQAANDGWLVTDDDEKIVSFNTALPVPLNSSISEKYFLWHIGFEDDFQGLETGNSLSALRGCFDLSNPLTFEINELNAGSIETSKGDTTVYLCASDLKPDVLDFNQVNPSDALYYPLIITDSTNNQIVYISEGSEINFNQFELGSYKVWASAGWDSLELKVGEVLSDENLASQNCFKVSNNFVAVRLDTIDAGCFQRNVNPDLDIYYIQIAPNPVSDLAKIEVEMFGFNGIYNIQINNLLGQQVGSYFLDGEIKYFETFLDVSHLTNGIYIVTANTVLGSFSKKFVVANNIY